MRMENFTWAFRKVIEDWRQRRPKQIRQTLPPDQTSMLLRYIRRIACMRAAPTLIECAKWSQTDPCPPQISLLQSDVEGRKGPFLVTSEYVCDGCKHPHITNEMLIQKLGLAAKREDFSERTWRRYVNTEMPMPVDQYRRVIANALIEGWLGQWQALSEWIHIKELKAARNSLVAVVRRASERKAFSQGQKLDISGEEIGDELAKQLRLLDHEAIHHLHQRLKDEAIPPELRKLFEEVIVEARSRPRSS